MRRVDAQTGLVSTVAGAGMTGGTHDENVPATQAVVSYPRGLAFDAQGNLYISQYGFDKVRKVDMTTGITTTVAGTGWDGYEGDGGLATSAKLKDPSELAIDASGNLYIADAGNHRIRRVDAQTKIITTVAGTGTKGFSGDGGAASLAMLTSPEGLCLDGKGGYYIGDTGNHRVRHVDALGNITTVAGTGAYEYNGDGANATLWNVWSPASVRLHNGELYFTDTNRRIRKIDANGAISTVAGKGWSTSTVFSGDGELATASYIAGATGLDFGPDGDLYFVDYTFSRIRKINAQGILSTVAGADWALGNGGEATRAFLVEPTGVAVASDGALIIADTQNGRIRKVDVHGTITTLAGYAVELNHFKGENSPAVDAILSMPSGLALDAQDNIYFADPYFDGIRKITVATGLISTVVKTYVPSGVAVDSVGNVFYAESDRHYILKWVAASNTIDTIVGGGKGFSGDGGAAETVTQSVTVQALALTLATAENPVKTYDGTLAVLIPATLDKSKVVSGDLVELETCQGTFTSKSVGSTHPVSLQSCTLTGAAAANYAVSVAGWSLQGEIKVRSIGIVGVVATPKSYDGLVAVALQGGTVDSAQLVSGDKVQVTEGSGEYRNAMAGNDKEIITQGYSLTGDDAGNYTLTAQPVVTGNVLPIELQVKAQNATLTRGNSNPVLHYTVTGFIDGEGESAFIFPVTISCAYNYLVTGDYPIEVSGALAQNYTFDYTSGMLTVIPASTSLIEATNESYLLGARSAPAFDLLGRSQLR